ncbi:MAG: hypothetical protein AAFO69_05905 [Bacteroidota bacterium]
MNRLHREEKDGAKPNCQHEVKEKQAKIAQTDTTYNTENHFCYVN